MLASNEMIPDSSVQESLVWVIKKIQWLRLIEAYDEEGLKDKALKIRHALIKSYSVDMWSSQYLTEN